MASTKAAPAVHTHEPHVLYCGFPGHGERTGSGPLGFIIMKRARIRLAYTLDHHSAVVGFRMVGNPACADLCRGALSDERPYRELHQDDRQGLSGLDRIPVLGINNQ
jgi:hypothetical protein